MGRGVKRKLENDACAVERDGIIYSTNVFVHPRTIPSDDLQVKVIVDLVHHFNWTYLSTLATDSVYGELGEYRLCD